LTEHHIVELHLPNKSQDRLGKVLANRDKQLGFRLAISFAVALCYGWFTGWIMPALWFMLYGAVQGLERRSFTAPLPWVKDLRGRGTVLALAVMALSNAVFGSLSVAELPGMGAWGEVSAGYVVAGAILNSVLITINCRAAFIASVLPFALYLCLMAAATLQEPSGNMAFVSISLGGGLFLGSAVRLWVKWSRAQEAEIAAIERDIIDRSANEQTLYRLAHFDVLTSLPNGTVLHTRLAELVASATPGALLMVDLDGFKYVNDTLGHSAGDQVLREVAGRLVASARPCDVPARLGGDEFALLMPGVNELPLAILASERLIAALSRPVLIGGQWIDIGISVGIALYPVHGSGVEELLSNAGLALYQAKAEGRHCSRFYTPGLRTTARGKMSRDTELAHAAEGGEFELFYQPQVRLSDGAVAGAEGLLRWRHPVQGLLTPAAFLPALEGGRLATDVGDWVVETACKQAAEWRRQCMPDFRMAVNLFGAQFRADNMVGKILAILDKYDLPPEALEIEITENIILSQEDSIVAPLRQLRALGVGVAFDDYGTGYASLSLLKRYPLTQLKIDQSFTRAMLHSASDATIVRAIISLARAFELQVVAEGIEDEQQARMVTHYGCEKAQGYLFGKPMSSADFANRFVREHGRAMLV
jgi:diguanylate cyclase (GGDEF)-like protein